MTIYILKCESQDTYKKTSKASIKRFVDEFRTLPESAQARENKLMKEHLVLFLPLGTTGASSKMSKKIFEKLRGDFNKDVCLKLDL